MDPILDLNLEPRNGGIFGGTFEDGSGFLFTFSQENEEDDFDPHAFAAVDSSNVPSRQSAIPVSDSVNISNLPIRQSPPEVLECGGGINDGGINDRINEVDASKDEDDLSTLANEVSSENSIVASLMAHDDVCWVGSTFDTLEDCCLFFREYAISRGYKIRLGRKRYTKKDERCYHQELLCCYAGQYMKKGDMSVLNEGSVYNRKGKRQRVDKRCLCKVVIWCKLDDDGRWECVRHDRQHSHAYVVTRQRFLLRSGRHVNKDLFQAVFDMMGSGIRPSQAIRVLADQVGGLEALGMTRRMVYNGIASERGITSVIGDAQLLLDTFKDRVKNDPNFFFEISVNQENQMTNFLWSDEIMRSDYLIFGDVIVFDTTFRTNRYNMLCAPFIGIDNHRQNVVFAIAFLVGQKKEDFIWCFESFVRCMNGKKPLTLMTDQDQAIAHAADSVLDGVQHRFCLWHICENAKKNLKGLWQLDGFSDMFYKCLYYCVTAEEFYNLWDQLHSSFPCENSPWLTNLFSLRFKWSPALCKHIFSAGIRSSQRSESTNSVLTSLANRQLGLFGVFTAVEKMVDDWRNKRLEEDFRNNGVPHLRAAWSRLVIQASKVFTLTILECFEREFWKGGCGEHEVIYQDGSHIHFQVCVGLDDSRKFTVIYHLSSGSISCSCMLFEERGYLCCHALQIWNLCNVRELLPQYILHRWTKAAMLVVDGNGKYTCQDSFSRYAWRNSVMKRALNLVLEAQKNEHHRDNFEKLLSSFENQLRVSVAEGGSCSNHTSSVTSANSALDIQLSNPTFVSSNNFGSRRVSRGRRGRGRSIGVATR